MFPPTVAGSPSCLIAVSLAMTVAISSPVNSTRRPISTTRPRVQGNRASTRLGSSVPLVIQPALALMVLLRFQTGPLNATSRVISPTVVVFSSNRLMRLFRRTPMAPPMCMSTSRRWGRAVGADPRKPKLPRTIPAANWIRLTTPLPRAVLISSLLVPLPGNRCSSTLPKMVTMCSSSPTLELSRQDHDTAIDVYDARVGGGEAEPVEPVECSGDACQSPAAAPDDPTPGSLTFHGPGNLSPGGRESNSPPVKKVTTKTVKCKKNFTKKHNKCVKDKKRKKARKSNHGKGRA